MEELNLAHCRSQAKCQLVQSGYIKRIKLFLFLPYNKHLINRAKSVCMYFQVNIRKIICLNWGERSTSFPGPFPYLECGARKGPGIGWSRAYLNIHKNTNV